MERRRRRSLDSSIIRINEQRERERNREINRELSELFRRQLARAQALYDGRQTATTSLQLQDEVTHPSPMTSQQIKQAIESRPETNQDIRFLDKKKCAVCLSSWKEILLEEKCLVFTHCGHVFCRPCAMRIASERLKQCSICKRSLARANPPFRRLHLPLDPKLNEK